jgi:hypothetical protein
MVKSYCCIRFVNYRIQFQGLIGDAYKSYFIKEANNNKRLAHLWEEVNGKIFSLYSYI